MTEENIKEQTENPLIKTVFKQPIASIFINSESQRVLAYIAVTLRSFLGSNNAIQLPPRYDEKRKVWSVKLIVEKLPKALTSGNSYAAKELLKRLEPPEEPPMEEL